jgi:hypothetical protein
MNLKAGATKSQQHREVLPMKKFPFLLALPLMVQALPAFAAASADGGLHLDAAATAVEAAAKSDDEEDDDDDDHGGGDPTDPKVAILVPLGFFLMVVGIVGGAYYTRFRIERQKHETLRLLVEKGGSIPPELLVPPVPRDRDLRRGVLLVCAGLAIGICFALIAPGGIGLGVIPFTIGLGYLLIWKLDSRNG